MILNLFGIYDGLSNVEFYWDPDSLTEVYPVEACPPPTWAGDQGDQANEIWQGCWYIPDGSWNAESLWSWRGSADLWFNRGYHPFQADSYWIGGEHHHHGVALERGNYWGLKWLDQFMKVLERVAENFLQVCIDDTQFGFMPGRSTTDAIFFVCQLQEKFHAFNNKLYMAFVDLEKAFDRVPRRVIWWALCKLGNEEWLVQLI